MKERVTLSALERPDPTRWCYASGVVSVRETELLEKDFFEELLLARDSATVQALMRETLYADYFAEGASREVYLRSLDLFFQHELAALEGVSPGRFPFQLFEFRERFRDLREKVFTPLAAGETEWLLAQATMHELCLLVTGQEKVCALDEHFEALEESRSQPRSVGLSNLLDSSFLALLLEWKSQAQSPVLEEFVEAYVRLKATGALYRNRRRGVSLDHLRRFFVLGALKSPEADAALRAEDEGRALFWAFLPDGIRDTLKEIGEDAIAEHFELIGDDFLAGLTLPLRRTPFGPERVFAYCMGLSWQNLNLRLCLGAVADNLAPEEVAPRLRLRYV